MFKNNSKLIKIYKETCKKKLSCSNSSAKLQSKNIYFNSGYKQHAKKRNYKLKKNLSQKEKSFVFKIDKLSNNRKRPNGKSKRRKDIMAIRPGHGHNKNKKKSKNTTRKLDRWKKRRKTGIGRLRALARGIN